MKMKKRQYIYIIINIVVLLEAAFFLAMNYNINMIFQGTYYKHIIVVACTVIIVHFLKAIRLYIAFYGTNMKLSKYISIYCKVTPVSILFPFKIGEFFKIYCYGIQTGKMLKGVLTVILDRFVDTLALLTMIVVVSILYGNMATTLVLVLLLFVVIVFVIFALFPGGYNYWLKYMLKADASPKTIRALAFLEKLNNIYSEITNITKGRGIILYVLALAAWMVEIGMVAFLYRGYGENVELSKKISEYLLSAFSSNQTQELKMFVFSSVVLLLLMYILVKCVGIICAKRNKYENSCYL